MSRLFRAIFVFETIVFSPIRGGGPTYRLAVKRTALRIDDSGELKGEIKATDFESKHLEENRRVKVYLPPGHDPKKRYPVVYIFDSFENDWPASVEELITSGKVPPLILVGTAPGPKRFQEYVPALNRKPSKPMKSSSSKKCCPGLKRSLGRARNANIASFAAAPIRGRAPSICLPSTQICSAT